MTQLVLRAHKDLVIPAAIPHLITLYINTMSVHFLPGQLDCTSSTTPLPYTGSPFGLLWSDIKLFFQHAYALPSIVVPLGPWGSGELDEIYPSLANIYDITLHLILMVVQMMMLTSIPLFLISPIPLGLFVLYLLIFFSANHAVCLLLNGRTPTLESQVSLDPSRVPKQYEDEKWIFLNGVAVGYDVLVLYLEPAS